MLLSLQCALSELSNFVESNSVDPPATRKLAVHTERGTLCCKTNDSSILTCYTLYRWFCHDTSPWHDIMAAPFKVTLMVTKREAPEFQEATAELGMIYESSLQHSTTIVS